MASLVEHTESLSLSTHDSQGGDLVFTIAPVSRLRRLIFFLARSVPSIRIFTGISILISSRGCDMTFTVRHILARLTRGLRKGHRRSTARRFPSFVELETLEIRACQTDPMQMNGPPPMNVPIPMSVQTALSTRLAQAESKRLAADTLETQTFYNAVTEWNTTLDSGKQAAGNLSAATNSPLQQLLSNNALSPSLTTDFANSVDNTAPGASSFNGNVDWIKMRYLCGMSLLGSAGPYAPGAGVWRTTGDTPANTKYLYDVAALPTMTASGLDWSTLSFSVSANGNDESLSTSKYTVDFASSAIKSSSSYYNGAVADPGWRTAFNVAQLNPITNVGQFWQLSVFDSIQNGPTEVSANATWFDGEKYFSFSKVKGPENKLDVIAGFDNDTTQVSGGLHIDNLGSNNQERSEWLRMRQEMKLAIQKCNLA